MNVCSIAWLFCLLVFSAVFFFVPGVRPRQFLFAACNFAFVATMMPNAAGWALLAAFIGVGYVAASLLRAWPRKIILVLYLVLLLSAFVILKQYAFIELILPKVLFQKVVATVGWSYILFRQIQVAVDAYQGQMENLSLWNYVNFQLNAFGFVAGPIQRYEEFCQYWKQLSPILLDAESILRAYLRIFIGVFKIALIGAFFWGRFYSCSGFLADSVLAGQESFGKRLFHLIVAFYAYPFYIFFNFSGYCDMVIGGAALFGLKMPENFDRPYLSRNMIDFWTRWHRSLGFWIRDYIFTPMYKAIATHWPKKAASLAFLCYFAAFFLAGTWHGSTWNYVAYGFLNGLGLAVTKLWEMYLVRKFGRPGLRDYLQNGAIRAAAIVVTLNFACLTMFIFASSLERTARMIANVFAHYA